MKPVLSSLKGWRRWLAVLILLLAGWLGLSQQQAEQAISVLEPNEPGLYRVVSVVDGDTIVVAADGTNERVRLIGLDTPEKNHPQQPVQCFAQAASDHLSQLIGDQRVRLESDPTNQDRDRYNRLLRYVYTEDGTHLNAKQIEDGYGFAYVAYPSVKMAEFLLLEKTAREANRGLWGQCEINVDDGNIGTNSY